MPNTGDFDPAKAIQDVRQKRAAAEAEKEAARQRAQAEQNARRANLLELLRHAEKQLENIRNPVVSEFVITERWWTPESKWISSSKKRADQDVIDTRRGGFFTDRIEYKVATRYERQTRYYGSWLSLNTSFKPDEPERYGGIVHYGWSSREGWVKLRQPRAGYAYMRLSGSDPRKVGNITIDLTDERGHKIRPSTPPFRRPNQYDERGIKIRSALNQPFRIYESLEEVTTKVVSAEAVTQALDFVETGKVPDPRFY